MADLKQPQKKKPTIRIVASLVFIIGIVAVVVLSQTGYIKLTNIDLPFIPDTVHKISPEATVGVPVSYEFSELISLLEPDSGLATAVYTYYLGSGVGFPPMGLVLGIDGVLKGTPTAAGTSKFQVCVKDVGGRSACLTYSLTVNPANSPNLTNSTPTNQSSSCPTKSNPPCGSTQNGVAVSGVVVPGSCECPSDTTFAQMDNVTAGGPYKICTCK